MRLESRFTSEYSPSMVNSQSNTILLYYTILYYGFGKGYRLGWPVVSRSAIMFLLLF